MMRLLLSLLIVHSCFLSLVSCSTQGRTEDEEEMSATEESADGDVVNEDVGDSSSEDDLSAELDESEGSSPDEEEIADSDLSKKPEASDEDDLENELAQEDLAPEPVQQDQPPVAEEIAPPPPAVESVQVTDIRYLANSAGGTLVVESTGPVSYSSRMMGSSQYIIEIDNVELKDSLRKANLLRNLSGAFSSVGASQDPGGKKVKIFVQLASVGGGEPIAQAEGNTLVIVPSAPPVVAESKPSVPPAPPTGVGGEPVEKVKEGALSARTLDEFLTGNQRFVGKPISLQVRDADVRDVINFIADESGANIVMTEDVAGKISLKVRKIPWDQALVTVMRAKKLGYVRQGNVLRITTLSELQAETDAAAKILDSRKAIEPTIVKVYPVSYANMDDLSKNIKTFLSKDGTVLVDNRTSTIVVTDKEAILDRVGKLIRTLDVAPTQVMIEGKIVEALETFSTFMGINWNMSGSSKTILNSGGVGGNPISLTPFLGTANALNLSGLSGGLTVGTFDFFGDLTASLALAEQDSIARVLSSPRIAVMNREKAEITQGGDVISISAVSNQGVTTTQVQRDKIELKLLVTPQITSDASIIMDVEMSRQFAGPKVDDKTLARPINSRTAKTKVMVKNGQTAVIGGIYQSDDNVSDSGVPGLKDIPVLGWLFKSRSKDKVKNELLLFLTPKILNGGFNPVDDKG